MHCVYAHELHFSGQIMKLCELCTRICWARVRHQQPLSDQHPGLFPVEWFIFGMAVIH